MDALLRAAIGGDEAARTALVAANAARLQRYLDRRSGARLRREVSSADLLQEVFLRVFAALRAMPEDATAETFRRWLYRHADWVLQNHGRAAQRHHGESAGDTPPAAAPAPHASAGVVTTADEVAWLRALLQKLPAKYADVVRLRLEGLPFEAIGQRLGLDEAAARQRFARVLQTLRERTSPAPE